MYFNSNIKLMRKRRGRTQNEVASTLNMKRPTLSGYENGGCTTWHPSTYCLFGIFWDIN